MRTPITILSAVLNAATVEAAEVKAHPVLVRQMAELTWLAARGFSAARTGNAAEDACETAKAAGLPALVAALDLVVRCCAVEVAPNVVRFPSRSTIRAVPVVGVAR